MKKGFEICYLPPSEKDAYVYRSEAEDRAIRKEILEDMARGAHYSWSEDIYWDEQGRMRRRSKMIKMEGIKFRGRDSTDYKIVASRLVFFFVALGLVSWAFTYPIGVVAAVATLIVPNSWYQDEKTKPPGD